MDKERLKFTAATHLFLVKDGKILLLRRFNTGYEDGNYSVPAGYMDGKETAMQATIMEPHKCDELKWFDMDDLPDNMVPYVRQAIECFKEGVFYSEFGWK